MEKNILNIKADDTFSSNFYKFSEKFIQLADQVQIDINNLQFGEDPIKNLTEIINLKNVYTKVFKDSFDKNEISLVKSKVAKVHKMLVRAENFSKTFNSQIRDVFQTNIEELEIKIRAEEEKKVQEIYLDLKNDYEPTIFNAMYIEYKDIYKKIVIDKNFAKLATVLERLKILNYKNGFLCFLRGEYNNRLALFQKEILARQEAELEQLRGLKSKIESDNALKTAVIPEGDIDVTPKVAPIVTPKVAPISTIQGTEKDQELKNDLKDIINKYNVFEFKNNNSKLIIHQIMVYVNSEFNN